MNRRIFEPNDVPAHMELRLLRLEARVNALAAAVRLLAAVLPEEQRVKLLLDDSGARAQVESLWRVVARPQAGFRPLRPK